MFTLLVHHFPAVDWSSERLPFSWQLCQLIDIHVPQGPILFNTSMRSRSEIKRCVCVRLFAVNTEYESSGKCHLWGQIIRVGTLSAAGSNVCFSGMIFFWNSVQGANTPKKKRPLQAVRLSANASSHLNVIQRGKYGNIQDFQGSHSRRFDFKTVQNRELTARHVNQLGDYSEAVNSPQPGSWINSDKWSNETLF